MNLSPLRPLMRPYIAIYDAAMRLGPKWGPLTLGYGPIVVAIIAFLLKDRLLDPVMDETSATILIFVLFAMCGPLMNIGTKIVTENLHRGRMGEWPPTGDPRFDRKGTASPTMVWVEEMRVWSRG
jgi:hypothetical protein